MQDHKLSHFPPEREKALANLWRYRIFEIMYYRPNVLLHSTRVSWWVKDIALIAKKYVKGIDIEKARLAALVHDDAEMLTGDIPSHHKFFMSKFQAAQTDKEEKAAIEELSKKYPKKVGNYSYRDLLLQTFYKKSTEGQLVSYLDKLDAYCESLHEVLAGNICHLQSIMYYSRILDRASITYPKLKIFLQEGNSPVMYVNKRIYHDYVSAKYAGKFNKPHTAKSLNIESDFPFYNRWRELMVKNLGKSGVRELTTQKEFIYK